MSVLDRFEKSVEGAVNGVFAKFGSKDLKLSLIHIWNVGERLPVAVVTDRDHVEAAGVVIVRVGRCRDADAALQMCIRDSHDGEQLAERLIHAMLLAGRSSAGLRLSESSDWIDRCGRLRCV